MGSLCCVAARPHGSSTCSREWSLGRSDPFWRTNSSFSPPLSRRWNHRLHSDGLSYGSYDDGAGVFYGSSLSSNSKGSRSWVGGEQVPNHHYSASDGAFSYISSRSDSFQNQQLTPPMLQGVSIDEYVREPASEPRTFLRSVEGTPVGPHSAESASSRSDGSEYEHTSKTHVPSHRNFSSRCSFMSKAIHPLSYPDYTADGYVAVPNSNNSIHSEKSIRALSELHSPGFMDFGGTTPGETAEWGSASSTDFTDVSEQLEPECLGRPHVNLHEGVKCGLCERFLSQRSPWGSRRIVRGGDMPIASVLSCWHVYHGECLERATTKAQRHDPPCPLCQKSEENAPEQWAACRLKNGVPRLSPLVIGEGPSRVWSCGQVKDCVEVALHAPKQSSMSLSPNCSRPKRHLSMKGG